MSPDIFYVSAVCVYGTDNNTICSSKVPGCKRKGRSQRRCQWDGHQAGSCTWIAWRSVFFMQHSNMLFNWSKTILQFDVNPFFFLLCFSSSSATSFRRRGSSKLLQPGPQQLPRCHEHFSASTSGYQPTTSRWSVFEIIEKAFITCVLQCDGRQCIEMFSFCLITYSR